MKSSLSGSFMFPPPGRRRPGKAPPGRGPSPGPTGSNLAPGGAPIGGKKPSPPQGPLIPELPGFLDPKIGWLGPTNIPSPSLKPGPPKRGGGANGFLGIGSKSRRPISKGLRGGMADHGSPRSGANGGGTGLGRGGCGSLCGSGLGC